MLITPTLLAWGAITTGTTPRYTVATAGVELRSILLLNPTSGAITVTATITPTTGAAIPIVPGVSVAAHSKEPIDIPGGMVLSVGAVVTDSASATGVTIVLNGIVVS